MRALLTGGAGFVGSHLSETLLNRGYAVQVLDDLSTGSIENIRHLKGRPGFDYLVDSVTNERLTAELIDGADVIFHLAAAVGVKLIVEAPVRTQRWIRFQMWTVVAYVLILAMPIIGAASPSVVPGSLPAYTDLADATLAERLRQLLPALFVLAFFSALVGACAVLGRGRDHVVEVPRQRLQPLHHAPQHLREHPAGLPATGWRGGLRWHVHE